MLSRDVTCRTTHTFIHVFDDVCSFFVLCADYSARWFHTTCTTTFAVFSPSSSFIQHKTQYSSRSPTGRIMSKGVERTIRWFLQTLQTHPVSLSTATLTGFTLVGVVIWNTLPNFKPVFMGDGASPVNKQPMTLQEARLRAMIENAKDSTWQENLDNAYDAHENFMLPGRENEMPAFMKNINKRSSKILRNNQDQLEKEKQQRANERTRFWR